MKTQSRMLMVGALLVGAPISHGPLEAQEGPGLDAWGITAVPGLELGHHTLSERPTGCTVVLAWTCAAARRAAVRSRCSTR